MTTPINYTHIFEDSLNEIYVFSADTLKFLEVNRGARENLGYSMEELKVLTPLELKHDYTADEFKTLITPLLDGSRNKIIFETNHYRKDGSHYPVEVHLHLSEVEKARVFVAIILDITERRKAEDHALQLAMEQGRIRLLREFVNDMSHDLGTPITQLKTSLYLLKRLTTDDQQTRHIQNLDNAILRIQSMLDSILKMNKLDLEDNQEIELVDLNRLIPSVIDANEPIAQQNHITLRFSPTNDAKLSVLVDPIDLTRAIENILSNSLQFTPVGGTITVKTSATASHTHITICDTGVGIEPEHLPHIFKRFYRADNARSTLNGSNGMGLAIAKKIIDNHHGTIEVESTVGVGTTFALKIPIASQKATATTKSGT